MKKLVVKRYFLEVKDREKIEKEWLDENPDMLEHILALDDEELLEEVNNKHKNATT